MNFLRIKEYTEGALVGKVTATVGGERVFGCAFELKDNAGIQLLLPRDAGAVSVFLEFYDESLKNICQTVFLRWKSTDGVYDVYSAESVTDILGVGLYFDPKKSGIAAIFFLPVAGMLFRLVFQEFHDLRRITERRYVIKEFEIVDTGSRYALGKMQKYVILREVNSDVEEKANTSGSYYVFADNSFVYGIEIEGRK